ncbi:hypothetical protein C2S53_001827 [Perilla frutescens var. hirtella]|uniref:Uncharacterized protein n=1 Tax=Perilla frutescens var. hirtella TaxID=608512 RepID=A0AAD4IY62_PERFH|nr:hypothetical protein C2S53_001827 [Perilla frutescens var. hirtella]
MALQHTRSHSFPSGSQPSIIQVDESLLSEPTTPSSLSSVTDRIKGLQNLYENIDDLLLLPHIQRIIAQECSEKCVDEILEGYIMLLDACAAARDLISLAKKDAQELLSAVRRRAHAEASSSYLTSRIKLRKVVEKALKASSIRKKQVLEKGCETEPVVDLLMNSKSATSAMLNSLFLYMMGAKVRSRHSSRYLLMSKLMDSKKVSSQDEQTEFSKVDTALLGFKDDIKVDDLLNCLKEMESSIQILGDGLECLFRRLIKTRVLLLNILSRH